MSPEKRKAEEYPVFVIQQHDATTMHWDFRIEVDGVLKSWAVPKGPSTNPADKRLAVATPDHPMSYGDFEGMLPEGMYGAGPVIVWDRGRYVNITMEDGELVPIDEALERGKANIWLEGEKLRGGYTLIHSRMGGNPKNWLLIKLDDEEADARRKPVKTQPESVISGRTVADISSDENE